MNFMENQSPKDVAEWFLNGLELSDKWRYGGIQIGYTLKSIGTLRRYWASYRLFRELDSDLFEHWKAEVKQYRKRSSPKFRSQADIAINLKNFLPDAIVWGTIVTSFGVIFLASPAQLGKSDFGLYFVLGVVLLLFAGLALLFYRLWKLFREGFRISTRRLDPTVWIEGAEISIRYLKQFASKYSIDLRPYELRLRHNDYPGLEYTPHPEGGYTARIKQ